MSAIYIHIPFCRRACSYCDFYFSTLYKEQNLFVEALLREIIKTQSFLNSANSKYLPKKTTSLDSLYFGGGTPSLLTEKNLSSIFNRLHQYYEITSTTEITLEANPEDITKKNLISWKSLGINRLSIGVQSFSDQQLNQLNRLHNSQDSISAVKLALDLGITNISIDLIYGLPNLTAEKWQAHLKTFFSLQLPHVSCYLLAIEDKTKLEKQIRTKQVSLPAEKNIVKQYYTLLESMEKHGYLHYEISNFTQPRHPNKPNFNNRKDYYFSKHNCNYWHNKPYLGLGPSAHSFNGENKRYYNIKSNQKYIEYLKSNQKIKEIEILTLKQKYNEYLITSLRTIWGCDLEVIANTYQQQKYFKAKIKKYFEQKMMSQKKNKITLTPQGKLYSNQILLDLFLI